MPATSEVQICSNALMLLGADPIASFTDGTTGATLSSNLWPIVRDKVLRSHPWNCATKRIALAPEATAPAFDYAYSFLLPDDWLRTLAVGKTDDNTYFKMENGRILMDGTVCYLTYVFRQEDVTKYDALLTEALQWSMAAEMAYPLTRAVETQQAMLKQEEWVMKRARAVNGTEDTGDDYTDYPLISSRGRTLP